METGEYEFIRSHSRPGESQITFKAADAVRSAQLPELWYQLRKKTGDIRNQLPPGIIGPFFIDEFGDTFGNRSEEPRVGKECVRSCSCRGSPNHKKKKYAINKNN